jgi:hypothetical protein
VYFGNANLISVKKTNIHKWVIICYGWTMVTPCNVIFFDHTRHLCHLHVVMKIVDYRSNFAIEMKIYNLMRTTGFCNILHRVRPISKYWKTKQLKWFGRDYFPQDVWDMTERVWNVQFATDHQWPFLANCFLSKPTIIQRVGIYVLVIALLSSISLFDALFVASYKIVTWGLISKRA